MSRITIDDICNGLSAEKLKMVIEIISGDDVLGRSIRSHSMDTIVDVIMSYDNHVKLMGSPIERSFLDSLYMDAPAHGLPIEHLHYELKELKPDLYLPTGGLYLFPQFGVELSSRYRVDFLMLTKDRHREGQIRKLIVECDGHDFHERTKEQARKDKSRDRDLVGAGFTVMRFTGSEIHKDAHACADQALNFLSRYRA